MKGLVIGLLYATGMLVFLLWAITDKEGMDYVHKELENDPTFQTLPNGIWYGIFVCILIVMSLVWPIMIIKFPYDTIKEIKRKH